MHLKLVCANVCHFLEVYQCTNVVLSPWKNEHDNLKTICSLIFLAVTPCVRSELLYGIMSRPPLHNEVPLWQPTNWQADPLFVFASRKETIVNRCKEVGNLVISCKRRVGFVTLNAFDNSFRCQRPQQRFCQQHGLYVWAALSPHQINWMGSPVFCVQKGCFDWHKCMYGWLNAWICRLLWRDIWWECFFSLPYNISKRYGHGSRFAFLWSCQAQNCYIMFIWKIVTHMP